MELSPKQKQQVQMKFDSYCKKTIKGEVKHYWRELTRQKSKESLFSELTRQELEQLYSMDDYCFDRRYFPVMGKAVEVHDRQIAEAFQKTVGKETGNFVDAVFFGYDRDRNCILSTFGTEYDSLS